MENRDLIELLGSLTTIGFGLVILNFFVKRALALKIFTALPQEREVG